MTSTVSWVQAGRTLFLTTEGIPGLGTLAMRAGDEIWMLAGASTPMILRPAANAGGYQFVCDCFILDHMHGEIAEQTENVEETMRNISII